MERGALLTLDSYASASPNISIQDVQGRPTGVASISIPEAKSIGIRCMARGTDQTLVAGGWASTADGRVAEVLVIFSADGAITVSRVDPFASRQIAVAPDGTIWAQGAMGRNRDDIPDAGPSHGIIRHFDSKGKLIASFLPQAQLDNRLRTSRGYLAVSSEKVGWISWVEQRNKILAGGYVEISGDRSVREYPLPTMETIRGFGMTNSGMPVAGVVVARASSAGPERSAIMSFSREQGTWSALGVPGGVSSLAGKTFLGGSGDTLAIWNVKSRLITFLSLSPN